MNEPDPGSPERLQPAAPGAGRAGPGDLQIEAKAIALLVLFVLLSAAIVLYLMYARGVFEASQKLVLQVDDISGVSVGMDLTFSGFPIGRVQRVELGSDGKARMVVAVSRNDAHWLRTSTVFTLERGLVGGSIMRAYTGLPNDPPLPDGALRTLQVGDATEELPRVLGAVKELVQNLTALTAKDAPLNASLENVRDLTAKLKGPGGGLALLAGDDKNAKRLSGTLNAVDVFMARANGLLAHADSSVFGSGGVVPETHATLAQLNGLLADARTSLKKVDAVLTEAQGIGANLRTSTADLGSLRAEVEANLLRIESLINAVNGKWPFHQNPELKLP